MCCTTRKHHDFSSSHHFVNVGVSIKLYLKSHRAKPHEMFREHPEPGFSVFSKPHRSSVIKIRIVRKKKHHSRFLRSLDMPFVIEQPNSQRSTVVVSVHPQFIICVGISMLPGPSVFQNNESIPTYNQFEFLSSPSSSPAISDFEPICLLSPFGGPALFVWFEKPPPAQASVFNVSQLFSVPLCGECPAMSESVGITVCHVMCPTEKIWIPALPKG